MNPFGNTSTGPVGQTNQAISGFLGNFGANGGMGGNQSWVANWFNQLQNSGQNANNYPFSAFQNNTPTYNSGSRVVTSSNQGTQIAKNNQNFVSSYFVQPGNTLSQIASQYGVTTSQLIAANPQITNPNMIYPGQQINVPGSANSATGMNNSQTIPLMQAGGMAGGLDGTMSGTQPGPNANAGGTGTNGTQPGTTTGVAGGAPVSADGTAPQGATTPNTAMTVPQYQEQQFDFTKDPTIKSLDKYIDMINGLKIANDKSLGDEIGLITSQYSDLRNKQMLANQSYENATRVLGIREGRTFYAPQVQSGINFAAQAAGIDKLGQITLKENESLLAARKANNEELHQIVKTLSDLQAQKVSTVKSLRDDIIQQKEFNDKQQADFIAKNLPGMYVSLKSLPPDQQSAQLDYLAGKMGLDPTVLQSAFYNFNQEQTKGIRSAIESLISQYPDANISQDAYLSGDMNAIRAAITASPSYQAQLAKSRGTASAAGSGLLAGLPSGLQGRVISRLDKFAGEETVKRFNRLQEGYVFLDSLNNKKSKSPADDQAFVYQFAKALDPDSAVKEGEYKTIKKYSQSLVNSFGGEIKRALTGKGFLSEGAKKAIIATMKSRLDTQDTLYQNVRNQYSGQIDSISGKPGMGSQLLNDYSLYTSDTMYGGGSISDEDYAAMDGLI